MKVDVIKYKSDGNTLTTKKIELEKLNDNVYYHNWSDSDRYNTEYTDVYFCIGNTIFEAQSWLSRNTFNYKKHELMSFDKDIVLEFIYSGFASTLKIEVATKENLDVQRLIESRDQTLKERERQEQAKEEAKREEALKRKQEYKEKLDTALSDFLNGDYIAKDEFIALCKLNDVPLHIRTIGMLNSVQKCDIKIDSATLYGNSKKVKAVNLDKVFEAAKQLKNKFINT